MSTFLKSMIITVFFIVLSSCNSKDLKKDMVLFDKTFIPVLYYVHKGDLSKSEKAFKSLKENWDGLKKQYNLKYTLDSEWKRLAFRGDVWLKEAECAIKDGNAEQAFIQLDHLRYEWMDLRFRHDIEYVLDDIWDFEATLDIVMQTAYDPMIELMDWKEFVMLCYEMQDAWDMVEFNRIDKNYFMNSSRQEIKMMNQQREMDRMLDEFLTIVHSAELGEVQLKIDVIKTQYLRYLKTYGSFDTEDSFVATIK